MLGRLRRYEFVVVEHVIEEIARPEHADGLVVAFKRNGIRRERVERYDSRVTKTSLYRSSSNSL